jgi:hypothetical protein
LLVARRRYASTLYRTAIMVGGWERGHVAPEGDGRTAAFPGVGIDERNVFVVVIAVTLTVCILI